MKLSIRFKLTLWYSLILICTIAVYGFVTNVLAQRQLQRSPRDLAEKFNQAQAQEYQAWLNGDPTAEMIDPGAFIEQIRQEDLRRMRTASVSIFVILGIVSFGGGYLLADRLLRPLRKINKATRQVSADNLQIHINGVNTDDELGELIHNFNAMVRRLQTGFNLQKQFIENASHELKTPLTITQTNIEAALHDPQLNRADLESLLQQAITSTTFMNRLIEDLLLLAVTQEQVKFETVSMRQIVQQAVVLLRQLADQHQKVLTLTVESPDDIFAVSGNETLLQRAVMNCIENAIKYARSTIQVHLQQAEGKIMITIQDDGEGIPADQIDKVTERFYRVDSSRSRASGGTGLGLAITKTIVEQHHGLLHIESMVDTGTMITITFYHA